MVPPPVVAERRLFSFSGIARQILLKAIERVSRLANG
jgi:hypothetical protein